MFPERCPDIAGMVSGCLRIRRPDKPEYAYMGEAEEPQVKKHFCELMNEEKEHVAEFTAALFELTNEPLPEEVD